MLDLRRERPGARLSAFDFRAHAPVTDTAPFTLCGTIGDETANLWVRRNDGARAMDGRAVLAAY